MDLLDYYHEWEEFNSKVNQIQTKKNVQHDAPNIKQKVISM